GLASGRFAATRTGHMLPARMMLQRIARPVERDIVRQHHRQVALRYGNDAARFAVDHRDRATPIPLARYEPVPQQISGGSFARAEPHQPLDRSAYGGRYVEAVEE